MVNITVIFLFIEQVHNAGSGSLSRVCACVFTLHGQIHRSLFSPLTRFMEQGVVCLKYKASCHTVTLIDVVVALGWGVTASVHMAESRCNGLQVFIVLVHLAGWWTCTVCCKRSIRTIAHTHTHTKIHLIMKHMHMEEGYHTADIKKLHQPREHLPPQ